MARVRAAIEILAYLLLLAGLIVLPLGISLVSVAIAVIFAGIELIFVGFMVLWALNPGLVTIRRVD